MAIPLEENANELTFSLKALKYLNPLASDQRQTALYEARRFSRRNLEEEKKKIFEPPSRLCALERKRALNRLARSHLRSILVKLEEEEEKKKKKKKKKKKRRTGNTERSKGLKDSEEDDVSDLSDLSRLTRKRAEKLSSVSSAVQNAGHISKPEEPYQDLSRTHRHGRVPAALQFNRDPSHLVFVDRDYETIRWQSDRLHSQQRSTGGRVEHVLLDTQYVHDHRGLQETRGFRGAVSRGGQFQVASGDREEGVQILPVGLLHAVSPGNRSKFFNTLFPSFYQYVCVCVCVCVFIFVLFIYIFLASRDRVKCLVRKNSSKISPNW